MLHVLLFYDIMDTLINLLYKIMYTCELHFLLVSDVIATIIFKYIYIISNEQAFQQPLTKK